MSSGNTNYLEEGAVVADTTEVSSTGGRRRSAKQAGKSKARGSSANDDARAGARSTTYDVSRFAKPVAEGLKAQGFGASEMPHFVGAGTSGGVGRDDAVEGSSGVKVDDLSTNDNARFAGAYDRKSTKPAVRRGVFAAGTDPDMYPFNYVVGRRSGHAIVVGRDDRMSPVEARDTLGKILANCGIQGESNEFLYDFTQAMYISHALNGASVVGPGRAIFFCGWFRI